MNYIICRLDCINQKIEVLNIKNTRESALSYMVNSLDKKCNYHKLFDDLIEVYKISHGHLYDTKTLIYKYQIIEYKSGTSNQKLNLNNEKKKTQNQNQNQNLKY